MVPVLRHFFCLPGIHFRLLMAGFLVVEYRCDTRSCICVFYRACELLIATVELCSGDGGVRLCCVRTPIQVRQHVSRV